MKGAHVVHNSIIIYHSSFAICQDACHPALQGLEDRPPVEDCLMVVLDYLVAGEGPQDEVEVGRQAHQSWEEEGREDQEARHH